LTNIVRARTRRGGPGYSQNPLVPWRFELHGREQLQIDPMCRAAVSIELFILAQIDPDQSRAAPVCHGRLMTEFLELPGYPQ